MFKNRPLKHLILHSNNGAVIFKKTLKKIKLNRPMQSETKIGLIRIMLIAENNLRRASFGNFSALPKPKGF